MRLSDLEQTDVLKERRLREIVIHGNADIENSKSKLIFYAVRAWA